MPYIFCADYAGTTNSLAPVVTLSLTRAGSRDQIWHLQYLPPTCALFFHTDFLHAVHRCVPFSILHHTVKFHNSNEFQDSTSSI